MRIFKNSKNNDFNGPTTDWGIDDYLEKNDMATTNNFLKKKNFLLKKISLESEGKMILFFEKNSSNFLSLRQIEVVGRFLQIQNHLEKYIKSWGEKKSINHPLVSLFERRNMLEI